MKFIRSLVLLILATAVVYYFRDQIAEDISSFQAETGIQIASENSSTSTAPKVSLPEPLVATGSPANKNSALTVSGVVMLTNKEREKESLGDLSLNAKLSLSAEKKAMDILAKGYFAHVSPSGVGPAELAQSVGYDYLSIGENLALGGFKDDADLVAAWMASPGHRANILGSHYKEIGVAVVYGSYNGQNEWVAVQEFGTPGSLCDKPDSTLATEAANGTKQILSMKSELDTLKAKIDATTDKQTYNSLAASYNSLVNSYNSLVSQMQDVIARYNNETNTFNACLKENTG